MEGMMPPEREHRTQPGYGFHAGAAGTAAADGGAGNGGGGGGDQTQNGHICIEIIRFSGL